MNPNFLDFEQPIAELEAKIRELQFATEDAEINISEEVATLREKCESLTQNIFASVARLNDQPVMVIGQQKGRDTKEKIYRNFGMPRPEGYRKAKRLMELAERFNMPVITFIDTPGAYPGIGAEERGQSEAIARNLFVMANLKVPIICTVIGEGGSGGALAIGLGDRVMMLQYSVYSVISPEGCASILYKSAERAADAAAAMGITSERLLELGLIDRIVAEPLGGAHRDAESMAAELRNAITDELSVVVGA